MSWSDLGLGSGQSAGVSRGRIAVDTSGFVEARSVVVRTSREMTTAIADTDAKTKSLGASTKNLGAISTVAWATFIGGGLKAADSVRSLEKLITTFAGSTTRSAQVMRDLRAEADRTNLPFLQLAASARSILPALRGQVEALDEATIIAQKLAIIDPAQGFEGAGYAIREFLSGTYTSLANRFELSRSELQRIRDQYQGDTEGMLRALNAYLTQSTNLTDDALAEMGDTGTMAFAQMRDELTQLLAEGFEPVLTEGVIPFLRFITDTFRAAREGYPELVKIAAVMATIAGAGAIAGRGLPLLGIGGVAGAGQAGVLGASAYLGANIGVEVTQGIGRATGDERLQEADLGDAWASAKQAIFIFGYGLTEAIELIAEGINTFVFGTDKALNTLEFLFDNAKVTVETLFEEMADTAKLAVLSTQQFLANISIKDPSGKIIDIEFDELLGLDKNAIQREIDAIKNDLSVREQLGQSFAENLEEYNASNQRAAREYEAANININNMTRDWEKGFGRFLGLIEEDVHQVPQWLTDMATGINNALAAAQAAQDAESFTQDQVDAWIEHQDQLAEIDQKAKDDTLAAQEQYGQDLLDLQNKQQQAELDLLDQQAQARAELLKRRDDALKDAADKRSKAETDSLTRMSERIADLRTQSGRNEEEAQISLSQRLQRIWLDLQDKLADAASSLSGRGVFEALRGARRGERDAGLDSGNERERRQRQLQQQIEDEQKAHVTRLEQARTAEQERIAQIQAGYREDYVALLDKQTQERDTLRESQQEELNNLRDALNERLQEIIDQTAKEKEVQEKAFIKLFNNLVKEAGQHENRMINIQRQGQQNAEAALRNWWTRQQQMFHSTTVVDNRPQPGRMGGPQAYPGTTTNRRGGRALGGGVPIEGDYLLHPREHVLNEGESNFLSRMLGGPINLPRMEAAFAGASRGDVNIGTYAPQHHYPADLGRWDEQKLSAFVENETIAAIVKVLKGHQGKG